MRSGVINRSIRLLEVIFLVLPFSCGDEIERGNVISSPPVIKGLKIEKACPISQPVIFEGMGTVTAKISAKISSKVFAEVERVLVFEGDAVLAGDKLAVLDPEQVDAQFKQAEAGRDAAKAQADLARVTYERFKKLKLSDSISQQELDQVEADYLRARAAAESAEAAFLAIKDYTTITAPFDGVITAKHIDEGDLASPGRPVFTLETLEGFEVELAVPEVYMNAIQAGLTVDVEIDSIDGKELTGTVTNVSPAADTRSRSFFVRVSLDQGSPVKSGMFARVKMPLGKSEEMIVPASSIIHRGQLTGVYIVDEEGITHFRLVRLGRRVGDMVEIVSGFADCSLFVVDPPKDIKDGLKVEGL